MIKFSRKAYGAVCRRERLYDSNNRRAVMLLMVMKQGY